MNTAPDTAPLQQAGEIRPGHVLGRYELLMPIAAGGMAMVWAARLRGTRGFQKIVAVKTMLPKLSEDEQFEQMFLDEASLASQIRHPNIVEILDLGEQDSVLYLVMEWIDGVPLNQLMKAAKKRGGIPFPVAVRIAMHACAGLHAAHELKDERGELVGLVHRDISPQNILVTFNGVTKVVDFGVAKATALGDGATVAGQIKGKVGYMAPEQVKGESIDRRVDVFAMGIVLYALTTGKHPFRRESEAATMYNICAPQPVMPPRKVLPNYPPELESVVLSALAKDKDKRYATANELLRALDQDLPSTLRSCTDADVGAFVRELLGDKHLQRKRALAEALERANLQVESGIRASQTQTGISTVSLSPAQHSITTLTGADGELSGAPGFTATALSINAGARRKRILGAAALFGVLAGGGALSVVLSLRQGGAGETNLEPLRTVAAPVTPGEPVSPNKQGEAPVSEADLAEAKLPSEAVETLPTATGDEADPTGSASVATGTDELVPTRSKTPQRTKQTAATKAVKPAKVAPTKSTPAKTTPTKSTPTKPEAPARSWKHDPGF